MGTRQCLVLQLSACSEVYCSEVYKEGHYKACYKACRDKPYYWDSSIPRCLSPFGKPFKNWLGENCALGLPWRILATTVNGCSDSTTASRQEAPAGLYPAGELSGEPVY
jgi:hypothetical protein